MIKNIYLTPSEQKIYDIVRESEIISHNNIKEVFPDISNLAMNKIFSSLLKKKYLYHLKRGLYLVQKDSSMYPLIENPYMVATSLFPGYIGFSSALRLYDLIDYEPFTIIIVTKSVSKHKTIGQYEFKSVHFGNKAIGITFYKDVYVSTIPKTFFDCFYKPSTAGGYNEITKALYNARKINWIEFISYFKKFGSDSLCQRTGYILDHMLEIGYNIPDQALNYFRSRIGKKTRLYPLIQSKGKYIKEWKLTDNIGREKIFGWLHG